MKSFFDSILIATLLAGCGSQVANLPLAQTGQAAPTMEVRNGELRFEPVSVADLTGRSFDTAANEGKLVTFDGSFGRQDSMFTYGATIEGYKLWDRDGHGVRCQNIYTEYLWGRYRDTSRDFNAASGWLLHRGTFVKIEGAFHKSGTTSTKGMTITIPPSVDVYFIDGRPVREFVAK